MDITPQHEDYDMEDNASDNNDNNNSDNNNDDVDNRDIYDHGQFLYPDADDIEELEDIFHFVGTGIQGFGEEGSNRTGLPQSQTRLVLQGPVRSGPGPEPFWARTADQTGPRKLQKSRTAGQDRKKPVQTGRNRFCNKYINTLKWGIYRQNPGLACKKIL